MGTALRVAAVLVALIGPANAADNGYTGAEYLDDNSEFASGYSYALWVEAVSVADFISETDNQVSARQLRMRECFVGSDFNSDNLRDAVKRHLRDNPEELLQPAFVAVFGTFLDLCPN